MNETAKVILIFSCMGVMTILFWIVFAIVVRYLLSVFKLIHQVKTVEPELWASLGHPVDMRIMTEKLPRRVSHHTATLWFAGLAALIACGNAATAGDMADSVWLDYQEGLGTSGDIVMIDTTIEESTLYTYYASLVWNTGYMGLQRGGSGYGKHVHFAIWDSTDGTPVEVLWEADDVVTERFGGEGTGYKAMWGFNWQTGVTYRLCVTLEADGGVTDYEAHFMDPQAGSWKHLVTIRRSDNEYSFSCSTGSRSRRPPGS